MVDPNTYPVTHHKLQALHVWPGISPMKTYHEEKLETKIFNYSKNVLSARKQS